MIVSNPYIGGGGGGSPSIYPLSNIISEWKMQDNVLDTVGSNNGTATAITYATGGVGKLAQFNGATSKINISDSSDFTFGDGTGNDLPFSTSCLISFDNNSNRSRFLNKRGGGVATENEWDVIYRQSSGIDFTFYSQKAQSVFVSRRVAFTPTNGVLYHVVCTSDGSGTIGGSKIYINGVEFTDTVLNNTNGVYVGMSNSTSPLSIGVLEYTSNLNFHAGDIDVVRVWNKELTQTETTNISTAELAGTDINP